MNYSIRKFSKLSNAEIATIRLKIVCTRSKFELDLFLGESRLSSFGAQCDNFLRAANNGVAHMKFLSKLNLVTFKQRVAW